MIDLFFKKVLIFLTVIFVTASTAVAVTTYSKATTTSPVELRIVSTDEALLALSSGFDYGENVQVKVLSEKGILHLNMKFDFQTDQVYTYDRLFQITNNSDNPVVLSVVSDIGYISEITPEKSNLASGDTTFVKAVFSIGSNTIQETIEGKIEVEANTVNN